MSAGIELSVELYGSPVATLRGSAWRFADLQFSPRHAVFGVVGGGG